MDYKIKSRNIIYKNITRHTKKSGSKLCISKQKKLDKNIELLRRIGTESIYGEAFKGCYPKNCKIELAIKKIPIPQKDLKYKDKSDSKEALKKSIVWSELFFLKLTNLLVKEQVCPHLPLMYKYYICNNCSYENKNIQKTIPKESLDNCIIVINELADGDLKNFLTKEKPKKSELYIAYYQIYIAIYCIYKYFRIEHQDLHWGNVLYHKIKPGGYIKYIIDGTEILIPNIGYLFVLWDFGLAKISGKIEQPTTTSISTKYGELEDYIRVTTMLFLDDEQTNKEYDLIGRKLLTILKSIDNPKNMVLALGLSLQSKKTIKKDEIVQTFNTDKKIKIKDKTLKEYYVI